MKYFSVLLLTVFLVADQGVGRSIKDSDGERRLRRSLRGFGNIFSGKTTTPQTTTTTTPKPIREGIVLCDEEMQKHKVMIMMMKLKII